MAGIDLGTTNSAIATMESGQPRIVKLSPTEPLLPSVVFIDARGATYLGSRARDAMLTCEESEGTGYSSWKKRMGQDDRYHFPAARKTLSAPELSALIIGELLRVYRRDVKEDLMSCVVTVPAKFDHCAYDATNKAAELARLKHHPLLQEPIAAALAYGFTSGDQRANWMVFDLGGGTLDISLMAVREGRLVVLKEGQAGDPQLGGSQFDRELLDFVLGSTDPSRQERYQRLQPGYTPLRKQYRLDGFSEKTHRTAWNRLLLACEAAKIELSRREETVVDLPETLCRDESGRDVKVEVHVTRATYEQLIASDIERAVSICETLLRKNRMTGKDLDQLIAVGGPMKTPYIQTLLQNRLNVQLKTSVDPMTAVALGAALHAETIEIPAHLKARPVASAAGVTVKLEYEPTSKQPQATVAGVIDSPAEQPGGLRVEIRRHDHPWTSGHLPVDETGFFTIEVPLVELGRPYQSRFTTQVFDSNGHVVATAEEPKIWHPFPKVDAVLANTLSVATVGNETGVLVPQGERLPARKSCAFELARAMRKGAKGEMLNIPVVQAVTGLLGSEDTEHADCHLHVGSLIVKATDERITMDLPRGTEIEITFEVNESQQTKVVAFVPLLNEEFEAQVASEPYGIPIEDLEVRFAREEERLKSVREIQRIQPNPTVAQVLEMIDRQQTIVNIQQQLVRAREGEAAAMSKGLKLILELAATINTVWQLQTRARVGRQLSQLRQAATPEEMKQITSLEGALGRTSEDAQGEELRQLESEVSDLDLEIRHRPFYTLLLYVLALGGLRVTSHQHQVHQEAMELAEKLMQAGAPKTLTTSDIERIEAMNRRVREAYPELEQHVKKYLEENRGGQLMDSFGTSLKKKQ